jgi:hypothetical protein
MIYKRMGHWHLDVTIHGVRYREALDTTDRREASMLEKKRVAEIQQGNAASKSGREFARKPFPEAAKVFVEDRRGHVAERTMQFERERLKPLTSVKDPCYALGPRTSRPTRGREWRPDYQGKRSTWMSASFVS